MSAAESIATRPQALDEARLRLSQLTMPAERALAHKALLQTNILDDSRDAELFGDKLPMTFGIFRVFPTIATIDWQSPSGEFQVAEGETYLDFHIPKSDDVISEKTA